jgi:hypothetical protein
VSNGYSQPERIQRLRGFAGGLHNTAERLAQHGSGDIPIELSREVASKADNVLAELDALAALLEGNGSGPPIDSWATWIDAMKTCSPYRELSNQDVVSYLTGAAQASGCAFFSEAADRLAKLSEQAKESEA